MVSSKLHMLGIKLCKFLYDYGFVNSKFDSLVFILQNLGMVLCTLVYVDDIVIT